MQQSHDNYQAQQHAISEIEIVPIKPTGGIVGFVNLVLYQSLYLGSIAIITRPTGGYRLLYPTKKIGSTNINVFHPINHTLAEKIEAAVLAKYQEVINMAAGYVQSPAD